MDIKRAGINNFLAIGEAELKLHEKGLVLLQGENRDDSSQDSNGAGKSTIPDALSWCLYGVTARGETGDDVINRTAKKNCSVDVDILDAGTHWNIARHRKHKENKNRLIVKKRVDDDWQDMTLGTDKLTQALVEQIVGCSKEVFCSAIYAGQENLVDLPSMTDKALKVIVEEAAGIDRLQQGYKIASARATAAKKEHAEALATSRGLESNLDMATTNLESVKTLEKEWESDRDARMIKAVEEKKALSDELASTAEVDVTEEMAALEAKERKVNDAIDAANKTSSSVSVLEAKLEEHIASVRREKSRFGSAVNEVKAAEIRLTEVQETKDPHCDECGQVITDEEAKKAHIKTHEQRVANAREKAVSQKEAAEQKGIEARECKAELEKTKAKLIDTSKLKAALTKIAERKTELTLSASKVTRLQERVEEKQAEYVEARDSKNPHSTLVVGLSETLEKVKARQAENEKWVLETEHRVLVTEGAAKVFSPAGVRAHLLDQVTPFLNERTSHYLSILSDGNITAKWSTLAADSKGDLKEKFSIAVESLTGGHSFKSLSGGEKRKVRLSTYLALQDLVSSRASKPINLLIADEIDQAIDSSGLERLMSVLTEKATERGTAIVISHTDLKSWISNSVTIVKEEGMSRIEGLALS